MFLRASTTGPVGVLTALEADVLALSMFVRDFYGRKKKNRERSVGILVAKLFDLVGNTPNTETTKKNGQHRPFA